MKLFDAVCPSCGAEMTVDGEKDVLKCETCKSDIVVEEAIQNYLTNHKKSKISYETYRDLGSYYFQKNLYKDAYSYYEKAEKINSEDPIVILYKSLSHFMLSDYPHFEGKNALKAMKSSFAIMKRKDFSSEEIYKAIDDCGKLFVISRNYLISFYENNKLAKDQDEGYIERLNTCLDGFVFLDHLCQEDTFLKKNLAISIMDTIDVILERYEANKDLEEESLVPKLVRKRKKYEKWMEEYDFSFSLDEKNTSSKVSMIIDVFSYGMILLLIFLFIKEIYGKNSYSLLILWIVTIISFIPSIRKIFISQYGNVSRIIFVLLWIILLFLLFFL